MRCFIAVECPLEVRERLSLVQKELSGLGDMKLVEFDNMHLTLKFLGEVDAGKVSDVSDALKRVQNNQFTLNVRGIGVFPSLGYVRVVWAGVEDNGLTAELAVRVDDALRPLGFPPEEKFHPHVTLARVRGVGDKRKVVEFIGGRSDSVFGSYIVGKFLLMESALSPKGPKYKKIAEFTLG
ncbi:MAG: RNA 2',3'-cyclic phosphodiesterase [Candidatus Altiarchaeota archaeon]|nr:RNA 2',3'-cyclic phosphodiesterase [Candidatus Altiarchaeota archaeon]